MTKLDSLPRERTETKRGAAEVVAVAKARAADRALVCILGGLLLLYLAGSAVWSDIRTLETSQRVTGVVVEVQTDSVTLAYGDRAEKRVEVPERSARFRPRPKVGERRTILIPEEGTSRPGMARDRDRSLYQGVVVTLVGFVLVLGGWFESGEPDEAEAPAGPRGQFGIVGLDPRRVAQLNPGIEREIQERTRRQARRAAARRTRNRRRWAGMPQTLTGASDSPMSGAGK